VEPGRGGPGLLHQHAGLLWRGGPLVGWLTDRLGPRKLMPGGVLLLSVGLLASSQITTLWHLYLLYGVAIALGITSIGFVPTVIIVSRWFARHRATAMGIAQAGQGVGAVLLLPLIQRVIESVGRRPLPPGASPLRPLDALRLRPQLRTGVRGDGDHLLLAPCRSLPGEEFRGHLWPHPGRGGAWARLWAPGWRGSSMTALGAMGRPSRPSWS
jgi:nitrate/nitrite transporter NarK